MTDKFDLRKYLIENETTINSKLLRELEIEIDPLQTYGRKIKSKKLFDFFDRTDTKERLNYQKLGFQIGIDDIVNDGLFAEIDLTQYDWMAVLTVLEDAKRSGLHPMLEYNGKVYSNEEALELADQKAANDTYSETGIGTTNT
jgi:adenylate cyclase class IV